MHIYSSPSESFFTCDLTSVFNSDTAAGNELQAFRLNMVQDVADRHLAEFTQNPAMSHLQTGLVLCFRAWTENNDLFPSDLFLCFTLDVEWIQ